MEERQQGEAAAPACSAPAGRITGAECVLYSLKFGMLGMDRWHHPAPTAMLPLFAAQL